MSFWDVKNVVLYVAGTVTECLLLEVSVSRGSTAGFSKQVGDRQSSTSYLIICRWILWS